MCIQGINLNYSAKKDGPNGTPADSAFFKGFGHIRPDVQKLTVYYKGKNIWLL